MTTSVAPRLQVEGIVKRYVGTTAVDGVSLRCAPGESIGLVGHNGAGKSTLSKIIAGLERSDEGRIAVDGVEHSFRTAEDAIKAGIGLVPQRLAVVGSLTVRENLLLGHRERRQNADSRVRSVAADLGLERVLDRRAAVLRPAAQRLVMIARSLLREPQLLILDEPTAAFSVAEVDRLFAIVRRLLAEQGVSVLYVSHRLEELLQLVDRVTAMAQGKVIADLPAAEITKDGLADLMAGRHVEAVEAVAAAAPRTRPAERSGAGVLECRDVTVGKKLRDVTFDVRQGEVVGLTGLVGSGRTTLLNALCGIGAAPETGTVLLSGQDYRPRGMAHAMRNRIAYLPEDRARNSIYARMSVRENVTMPTLRKYRRWGAGPVDRRRERAEVERVLDRLAVKPANAIDMPMRALSGGNQQKCLIARWLLHDVDLFVFDEPTEGVDVHGREDIYRLIGELTEAGAGVLLSSSDIEEVVECCDRVLVLRDGALAEEIEGDQLTIDRVSRACIA